MLGTMTESMSWMKTTTQKDKIAAIQKAMEFGEKIPIGVLYREDKHTFHEKNMVLNHGIPLLEIETDSTVVKRLVQEFI